ncbi:Hypothetical protein, putative [Bodo saltans]|uniref:Protein kinase domain-containing protein n=1 Tax=Bodo saltans TaxID=75058 RepID=A0A0S4IXF4_BODSA|nr:Hypothetical protein, putative [Bodo saltans]|eukprot:CUG39747.1 Hypothetical protein, putative [Bodo saltans]
MGNNQASAIRGQFDTLELRESTKKQLWQVYFCTLKPQAATTLAAAAASPEKDQKVESDSPPASPTASRRPSSSFDGAESDKSAAAGHSKGESGTAATSAGESQQQPVTLVMLQLNTSHPSYRAANAPPKGLNPDHHVPSQYKLQYSMLEGSYKALQWLRDNPHRSLLRIRQVECNPSAETCPLVATTPYVSMEPVLMRLPLMGATEILYGLVKVAEALAHLHSNGRVHCGVSWKSVYLAYTTPSTTTARAEGSWVLGEPQFMSRGFGDDDHHLSGNTENIRDYFSEIRGARQDPSLLSYFAPEINNPYAASQLDWKKVPVGAGDVFSFGVMIDMVLNTERTRFAGTGSVFYNPATPRASHSEEAVTGKEAVEELRLFAKSCQVEDPTRRPDIERFFDLKVVHATTYVKIQQQLDHFRGSGVLQKVHFFYLLHAEALKVPYDQLVNRIIPRLLKTSVWADPTAEPFLRHLLVPVRGTPGSGKDGEAPTVMMTLPLAEDDALLVASHVPPPPQPQVVAGGPKERQSGDGDEIHDASSGSSSSSPIPKWPCVGLLQPTEYNALVGAFVKRALARVVQDLTTGKRARWSPRELDTVCPPHMLCVLLRYAETYIGTMSFTAVVVGGLLPLISLCLEHAQDYVVLEALHAFSVVHRYVMNVFERVQKQQRQPPPAAGGGGGAASSTAGDEAESLKSLIPSFAEDNGNKTSASAAAAAIAETASNARKIVVGIMVRNIFSMACCDAIPELRLLALTASVKALTCGSSGAWRHMPRGHAIACLSCSIALFTPSLMPQAAGKTNAPVHPFGSLRDAPLVDGEGNPASSSWLQVALRAVRFAQKIVAYLTPAEMTQDISPATSILLDRIFLTSSCGLWNNEDVPMSQVLAGECKLLLSKIFAQLSIEGGSHHQSTNNGGSGDTAEDDGNDDDEEDDNTFDAAAPLDTTQDLRKKTPKKRVAVVVDAHGWCTVRDPTPFQSGAALTDLLKGVPASYSRAAAAVRPKSSSQSRGKQDAGDSNVVTLGPWAGRLNLSPEQVKGLPTFSFVDCDYELNAAAVLRPDHVAAEIIAAASATRTYMPSLKAHPLAMCLPSRLPPSCAPEAILNLSNDDAGGSHSRKSKFNGIAAAAQQKKSQVLPTSAASAASSSSPAGSSSAEKKGPRRVRATIPLEAFEQQQQQQQEPQETAAPVVDAAPATEDASSSLEGPAATTPSTPTPNISPEDRNGGGAQEESYIEEDEDDDTQMIPRALSTGDQDGQHDATRRSELTRLTSPTRNETTAPEGSVVSTPKRLQHNSGGEESATATKRSEGGERRFDEDNSRDEGDDDALQSSVDVSHSQRHLHHDPDDEGEVAMTSQAAVAGNLKGAKQNSHNSVPRRKRAGTRTGGGSLNNSFATLSSPNGLVGDGKGSDSLTIDDL